jgi:hypothetical protein
MRALSAAAAVVLTVLVSLAHGAEPRRADADLRLAPLVERIARLHAQTGQGVMAQRSRRALADAVRDFDATLRATLAAAQGSEVRDNFVLLAMIWQDYREWALKPPTRETGRKLRDRTEEMSWVAAKGVRLTSESGRTSVNASALRAAQASAASQRIAKAYLWRRWDVRDEGLDRELREARENLPRALEAIAATANLTPEALTQVQSAQAQWGFLSDAARQLDSAPANARALEFACKAADHIYEAMERVRESLQN